MSLVKLPPVTEKQWSLIPAKNRQLYTDYFLDNVELSDRTKQTYRSNLKIWFWWPYQNHGDKLHTDVKSREYKRFQNWLVERECSTSDIATKRSTISSLNNYIMVYFEDEFPTFRNFINSSIKLPEKTFKNEKVPPTREELFSIIQKLEDAGTPLAIQQIAYLKFTFATGCRRAETRQLLKSDVLDVDPIIRKVTVTNDNGEKETRETKYYVTHEIRCKGRGKTGKVRRLKYDDNAHEALKRWLEIRGDDDCPYVFVTKDNNGKWQQASLGCFNRWCSTTFTELLGRRFHPHCLREARATDAVIEQGIDIEAVRQLLGHNDASTTRIYVCGGNDEELDDELFI